MLKQLSLTWMWRGRKPQELRDWSMQKKTRAECLWGGGPLDLWPPDTSHEKNCPSSHHRGYSLTEGGERRGVGGLHLNWSHFKVLSFNIVLNKLSKMIKADFRDEGFSIRGESPREHQTDSKVSPEQRGIVFNLRNSNIDTYRFTFGLLLSDCLLFSSSMVVFILCCQFYFIYLFIPAFCTIAAVPAHQPLSVVDVTRQKTIPEENVCSDHGCETEKKERVSLNKREGEKYTVM